LGGTLPVKMESTICFAIAHQRMHVFAQTEWINHSTRANVGSKTVNHNNISKELRIDRIANGQLVSLWQEHEIS